MPGRRPTRVRRGFTLVEAMLILVIMSVVAVGVGVGLQGLTQAPSGNEEQLFIQNKMVDLMESLRATSFDSIAGGTGTSFTFNKKTYTPVITVATVDADGNGAVDSDFKQVTVSVTYAAGETPHTLSCYIVKP